MIVPDLNVLIYATDSTSPHFAKAHPWWTRTLSGSELIGLAWSVSIGFVRLTTNPRVFAHPLTAAESIGIVSTWLASANVVPVEPTGRHLAIMQGLLVDVGVAGNLIPDAHLAALAMEHGATLASADADFDRFMGLRRVNPVEGS